MQDGYKKLEKIVVNVGVGRLSGQPNFEDKILPEIMKELAIITGQKAATRPVSQSIAGFKTRVGVIVGLKTTLRGNRLKEFLQKLIQATLPRVRDFRGINLKSVDAGGNLTIGLKDHLIFPEISPELSKVNFGMEITLVPKISDRVKALELYKLLGIPFSKNKTEK